MPIAETIYTCFTGKFRLLFTHFWISQVIISEISRNLGLIMSSEKGFRLANICPFGKSFTPPFVVLRNGMVLR